jgi:eukaryotic-like serine/threonine-protein kinase
MPPMTGRVIAGRYNLQHPIGRGAMGVVWRARDQLLDRDVAVKEVVISALIGADERRNAYQRTLREARTAARLSHRGVVAVYDVAEEDGRPWIVMELVPSQSLDQVLVVEGRLPPARAGRIGQQLLSALAAAHAAGVLHRDVKPSNVLIATNRTGEGWDERAVLTDFGIAQFEGDPRLTQTGMVMGSPGFTAPERIRGSDATPASDLWSLGATIYAAVEGRGPYEQRGGAITTMSAIINEDAPIAPHARQLAPVIAALLRRDPSTRPSAAAAARMFAQALPQLPETTEEPPALSHPPTVRSAYVPPPAEPLASSPVTAPDSARSEKSAPAAKEPAAKDRAAAVKAPAEPAKEAQEAQEAAQETPSAEKAAEAEEAASVSGADSAEEPDSADAVLAAAPEPRPAPEPQSEPAAESKSEPAAETAEFKVSAPDSADVPVPAPAPAPADAPAAEAKAAAALLDAPPAAEAAGSRAADTVIPGKGIPGKGIPGKGPAGYQPTEVSVPAARITPSAAAASAAAPAKPAESKPAEPKPTPSKPADPKPTPPKPGPTFTAAKPTGRAMPTFSAASPAAPARSVRPSPPVTPSAEQHPAYGPNAAAPGYPPPAGGTTPFPPSGAHYGPSAGQYAGPAQPYPDLARQYPPGTGGGRAGRGRGQSRRILWLVVAVIVAAAVGVGTALALNNNGGSGTGAAGGRGAGAVPSVADTLTGFKSIDALNNPSTALPAADWSTQTVTAAAVHSAAAGFSIDVPPGWTKTPKGLATDFNGPGDLLLEVDLTQQPTSDMLTAAKQVEAATHFRDYKRLNLQPEPVRHAQGAVWKFNWTPAGGAQLTVDDIFFAQQTPAGVQDYAIYIRSPSSTFGSKSLPLFEEMLRTFQTVPAT